MKKIIFFTEMGNTIGFGHLSRCLSIANSLISDFYIEFYIFSNDNKKILFEINPKIKISFTDWKIDYSNHINSKDIVIIDSYLANEETYKHISTLSHKSIAFDDYYRINYETDFILNPNVFADETMYNYKNKLVIGNKYVILRKEFRKLNFDKTLVHKTVKNVTITIGGSDEKRTLVRFLSFINHNFPTINFHFLCANQDYKNELINLNKHKNNSFSGFLNANELISLFEKSEVVISACGQTLGELVVCKTPFIGFIIGEDQIPNQQYYLNRGILEDEIDINCVNFEQKITKALTKLLAEDNRQIILNKLIGLIDGKGVNRICKKIKEMSYEF